MGRGDELAAVRAAVHYQNLQDQEIRKPEVRMLRSQWRKFMELPRHGIE
jgi:hypothetical protein